MPFIEYKSKKILYLHVPRTGGGSIEAWLENLSPLRFHSIGTPVCLRFTPQHMRMADFVDLFGDKYFDFAFMTVRNPYDRIISEYKMRLKIGGQSFSHSYRSFSYWLASSLDEVRENPNALDNHMRPQWEFIGLGVEPMKFENTIPAIIRHIALKIDAEDTIPPLHKHSTADIGDTLQIDETDRLKIQEYYRKDFEIFGYDA